MNKNIIWDYMRYSTQFIDINVGFIFNNLSLSISSILNKIIIIDKLQVVLFITWACVYTGLLVTKFLEYIFKVLLKLPDSLLKLPISSVENTNGKNINILSAENEQGAITNKLRMLMRIYWQKGGADQVFDESGIDCQKIFDLLKCSVIYICYLLEENNKAQENSTKQENNKAQENSTKQENNKAQENRKHIYVVKRGDTYFKSNSKEMSKDDNNYKKILMRQLVLDE